MRLPLILLLGAGLLHAVAGHAADDPDPPDPIDQEVTAKLAHDPSTRGQIHAFLDAQQRWEAELPKVLVRLRKKLSTEDAGLLDRSQRDWLAFRDSDTELRGRINAGHRGTLVGIIATEANMLFVRDRVLKLRRYEERAIPPPH